jgi:hypothetical protein
MAFPVFPSNLSIVGSIPTPYIFDDRAEPFDIAEQIQEVYALKTNQIEEYGSHTRGFETYEEVCKAARDWVTSDESMQSARWMCKNIIDGIDETFANWQPRHSFELIQVETPKQPKHYNKYVIAK